MEEIQAVRALSALAHESRLRVFRLLAKQGAEGLSAGKIAEELQLPAATLSFHLKELLNADLIVDRREGRSVIYAVNPCQTKGLLNFLLEDCCGGRPELCGPGCETTQDFRGSTGVPQAEQAESVRKGSPSGRAQPDQLYDLPGRKALIQKRKG